MIRSLQHVGLSLPNPELARSFYSAFGLEVGEKDGRIVARCAGRDQDQVVVTEGKKRGLAYLSFGAHPEDIGPAKARLEARGVTLLDPPAGAPAEGLWFRDPDGNLIHVGVEQPATPRKAAVVSVNTHSAVVRSNLRGCPPFGMKPQPLRLGHVILFTPDPPRQAEFYQTMFGMKLSDSVGDNMVMFLRGASDGDHHLLGLLRSQHPGLHHASFEMDSVDHIELAARSLKDSGFQHVWGTGRHSVGSNMFHYFRDPWGTLAEYFYDLDYIPEGATWEPRLWKKEEGLFLWSNDGPPPPDFPQNLVGEG